MTGALLGLGSAVCFGIADYAGGLLSRRASAAAIALAVQVSGCLLMFAVAPLVPAPGLGWHDLGWGALSGVGTAVGVMFLYRGLVDGDMSVVVPVSTVGSVVLPVLVGLATGEHPSVLAWLGIVVALPAIALISGTNGRAAASRASGVGDGLISSAGFALQYVALAQAGATAGLWPVTAGRLASVLTMLALAVLTASRLRPLGSRLGVPAALNGAVAAAGLVLYMLATRQEIMAVAVVLSALYPAIPVLLGITVLGERLRARQTAGLVGAGLTVVLLVTAGR